MILRDNGNKLASMSCMASVRGRTFLAICADFTQRSEFTDAPGTLHQVDRLGLECASSLWD
jgi:hypothetical protein